MINTGHDVRLTLDDPYPTYVNISGGPFSYQYRVHEIVVHFGKTDSRGSEHSINGLFFPAEVSFKVVFKVIFKVSLKIVFRVSFKVVYKVSFKVVFKVSLR